LQIALHRATDLLAQPYTVLTEQTVERT
jgi:hypothetical protein